MSGAFDSAQKAEVLGEPEESRCGEAALLAADYRGCGQEWNVDSGVLPAASPEGEPVLLVAAQAENAPAGAEEAGCLWRIDTVGVKRSDPRSAQQPRTPETDIKTII